MRRVRSKQAEATSRHSMRQSVGRLLANKTVDVSRREKHYREASEAPVRAPSEEAVNPWGIEVRKEDTDQAFLGVDVAASEGGASVASTPHAEKRVPYTQRRTRAGTDAVSPRRASALLSEPADLVSFPVAEDTSSISRSSTPPSSASDDDVSDGDFALDNPDLILSRRSSVVVVFSDVGLRTALSERSDTHGDVVDLESQVQVESLRLVQAPVHMRGTAARPSPRRRRASPLSAQRKFLPPPPVHFRLGFFGLPSAKGGSSMASTLACIEASVVPAGMDETSALLPTVPCAVPWTWPPKPRGAAAVGVRGRPRRKNDPVRRQDRPVATPGVDIFDF